MYEVHRITLHVLVDRDEEDRPDKWDWSALADCWAKPIANSIVIATFETVDAFYDSYHADDPWTKV